MTVMLGAAITLATAISAPAMAERDARAFVRDYPTSAHDGRSAAVNLELTIDPDGKVRDCAVVSFVGDERLAREQCARLSRIRYSPATGPDGEPILAKYRTFVSLFMLEGRHAATVRRAKQAPDLTLTAATVPDKGVEVDVDLLIDVTGVARLCDAGKRSQEATQAVYVEAACQEALRIKRSPLANNSGEPVEYVANMRIRFVAEPTA